MITSTSLQFNFILNEMAGASTSNAITEIFSEILHEGEPSADL